MGQDVQWCVAWSPENQDQAQNRQHQEEIDDVGTACGQGEDDPGKVDFTDQIPVADDEVGAVTDAHHGELPGEHTDKDGVDPHGAPEHAHEQSVDPRHEQGIQQGPKKTEH